MDKKIPVVVLVQGSDGNSAWDRFNDRVLKKYTPNPNYFYVRIAQSAKSKIENLSKTFGSKYINMTQDGDTHACMYKEYRHRSAVLPHVFAIWTGIDKTAPDSAGTKRTIIGKARLGNAYEAFQVKRTGSNKNYDPVKGAEKFQQWQDSYFDGFQPVATSYDIVASGEMTLLGRNMGVPYQERVKVRYFTSDGSWRDVSDNGKSTFDPEVRVDKYTTTNFKYGTWYYNASYVKKFADRFHIPVLIEYSSEGCDPCDYFKKNIYKDKAFQDWVSRMNCLFVRIEIKSGERWDDPHRYPQPYFVDHEWVGEGTVSIPVFCWYWNKQDDQPPMKVTTTYHFSPGQTEPPFTMNDLMLSTEQFFSEYTRNPAFNKVQVSSLYNTNLCVIIGRTYENQPTEGELNENSTVFECLSAYNYQYLTNESNPPFTTLTSQLTLTGGQLTGQDPDDPGFIPYADYWQLTNQTQVNNHAMQYLSDVVYKGEFDCNGSYFPCDKKVPVDFISTYMTICDP